MTLQIEVLMEVEDAQRLCDEIRSGLAGIAPKILALRNGQGWRALGYATWEDLVEAEFGGVISLPRADRSAEAKELRAGGMTYKDIASTFGVSVQTAHNDAADFPLIGKLEGDDGRARPASYTPRQVPTFGPVGTAQDVAHADAIAAAVMEEEWFAPVTDALGFMRDAKHWLLETSFEDRDLAEVRNQINEIAEIARYLEKGVS